MGLGKAEPGEALHLSEHPLCHIARDAPAEGQRIVSVMADLKTFIPVRRRPTGPVETFATETSGATVSKTITTEDCATILLRYESGAIGNLTISQISAGRKNTLEFEIDG